MFSIDTSSLVIVAHFWFRGLPTSSSLNIPCKPERRFLYDLLHRSMPTTQDIMWIYTAETNTSQRKIYSGSHQIATAENILWTRGSANLVQRLWTRMLFLQSPKKQQTASQTYWSPLYRFLSDNMFHHFPPGTRLYFQIVCTSLRMIAQFSIVSFASSNN